MIDRPTRIARVAYTLVWPGLGHLLDRRPMRGAVFAVWTLAVAISLMPAFAFPRPLLVLELAVVAALATVDVLRDARRVA
jgi:hypothetical protein